MGQEFERRNGPDITFDTDDHTAEADVLDPLGINLRESPDLPDAPIPQQEQGRHSVNRFEETTIDEEAAQPRAYNLDTERHLLEQETMEKAVDAALSEFADILAGRDDYVIFASTALYLQAREHYGKQTEERREQMSELDKAAFERFSRTPGDLDISVKDRASMLELYRRLNRHEGVQFDEGSASDEMDGPMFVSKMDGARILRGSMRVQVDGQLFDYPFEMFTDSFVVPKEEQFISIRGDASWPGLRTLNLTGLKQQYGRNFAVEQRLRSNIERVEAFLNDNEVEVNQFLNRLDTLFAPMESFRSDMGTYFVLTEQLDMTEEDMRNYYRAKADILAARGDKAKEKEARTKIEMLVGGMKTKLQKRMDDLAAIEQLQRDII